jgi:cytochrome c oxidase subunit 2
MRAKACILGCGCAIGVSIVASCGSAVSRASPDSIARSLAAATTRDSKGESWRGKQLYKQLNCSTCHSIDGSNGLGPTMKGYFGSEVQYTDGSSARVDDKHARESIIDPSARIMSGYGPTMPPVDFEKPPRTLQDVDDLVAYIKELK